MDPLVTAGLISAGSSLLGGLFGSKKAKQQNDDNVKYQKQFAQHGLSWRVDDARRAGIHPVAALGAQGASYSPSAVVDPMGDAMASAGQSIANSVRQKVVSPVDQSIIDRNKADADFLREQTRASIQARINQKPTSGEVQTLPVDTAKNSGFTLPGGKVVPIGPHSGAEFYEQRYGDIAQELGGVITLGGDLVGLIPDSVVDNYVDRQIRQMDMNRRNRTRGRTRSNRRSRPAAAPSSAVGKGGVYVNRPRGRW